MQDGPVASKAPEPSHSEVASRPSRRARWAMAVLWPAFLMAAVLEALVFSVVDPDQLAASSELAPSGGATIAVYTMAFACFWAANAAAASLALLLATERSP